MIYRKASSILVIILFFAAALIIRLGLMHYVQVIETDGVGYVNLARLFSGEDAIQRDEQVIISSYAPGYPFFISLVHIYIKDWEAAGRIVSAVFGSVLVILVFLLTKFLYGQKTALFASVLVLWEPILATCSVYVLTEIIFSVFFITGVLLSFFLFKNQNKLLCFVLGLIWSICCLIKPEAVVCVLIVNISIVSGFFFFNKTLLRQRMVFVCLFFIGFASVYCAYLFFCFQELGTIIFVPNSQGALSLLATYTNNAVREEILFGLVKRAYHYNLFTLLKAYFHNLYYTAQIETLPRVVLLPWLILIIIGQFRLPWVRERSKKEGFILLFLLFFIFFYPIFPVHERRFVPMVPLIMILVANGINAFGEWWKESFGGKKIALFLAFFVVFLTFVPRLVGFISPQDWFADWPIEYREVGYWMKDNLADSITVMSRGIEIAYYADAKWIPLPYATLAEIIRHANSKGVDYMVIDKRWAAKLRPNIAFLLEDGKVLPEPELVYTWDRRPEYKVVVYKLKKQQ